MTTRPKVTDQELARTIERIAARRVKVDDPDRHLLPDSPAHSDPREIVDYLARHARVPRWVAQADVSDALTLNNWLWWQDRRRERHWLRAGLTHGLFLSQLGAQVGVGKQGVRDRLDRLEALLQFDRPDEQLTRSARRAEKEAAAAHATEQAWITAHTAELTAVVTGLLAAADRYQLGDEEREWLDELATDAREDRFSPGSLTMLNLAVAELRTAPTILALEATRPHAVHHWLTRADQLRTDFAALGTRTGATGRGMLSEHSSVGSLGTSKPNR